MDLPECLLLKYISVLSGCYGRTPGTGRLMNKRHLLPLVRRVEKSEVPCLVRASFLVPRWSSSLNFFIWQRILSLKFLSDGKCPKCKVKGSDLKGKVVPSRGSTSTAQSASKAPPPNHHHIGVRNATCAFWGWGWGGDINIHSTAKQC